MYKTFLCDKSAVIVNLYLMIKHFRLLIYFDNIFVRYIYWHVLKFMEA